MNLNKKPMLIGEEYKEKVEKAYAKAMELGVQEILLDEKILGGIKLYISKKPVLSLGTFVMEDGTEVSVGEESFEAVS